MTKTNSKKIKKMNIIINPASGRIEPILPVINSVLTAAEIDWDVMITKKAHDASKFAKESVEAGVDAIGVYGGDGTVMEVVNGMMGSDIPLVIFPGGTANVLATDLNIPKNLKESCELLANGPYEIRNVDVGSFNKRHFILRLGLGFEAEMVKGADRTIKNKFGTLAYVISAFSAMQKMVEAQYHITIDGKKYDATGFTCIVANSGNIGFPGLSLDNAIDVSDGLLNVLVVRQVNIGLFAHIMAALVRHKRSQNVELVQHWQGKDIRVTASPKQVVQCDGEVSDKVDIHATVVPSAIKIIVPKPKPTPASS